MVPGEGLSPVEIALRFQAVRGWWVKRDLERWDTFQGFLLSLHFALLVYVDLVL